MFSGTCYCRDIDSLGNNQQLAICYFYNMHQPKHMLVFIVQLFVEKTKSRKDRQDNTKTIGKCAVCHENYTTLTK